MVRLSDTLTELSRNLEVLRIYCVQNNLTINVDKTKIVIFHREGYFFFKQFNSFKCDMKIGVVKIYMYLYSQTLALLRKQQTRS